MDWTLLTTLFEQGLTRPLSTDLWVMLALFMPFVLFLELPVYILQYVGILIYWARKENTQEYAYLPKVSCLITCYSEGALTKNTIRCLAEQDYAGCIEIIPVVDGAGLPQNRATLDAVNEIAHLVRQYPKRLMLVLPKWQRGGRVSSLNTGLSFATGEIIMALDADTSFDNNMVTNAVRHFTDPNVIGVSGALRVRNANATLVTRLQTLEYLISIHAGRTGLDTFNIINNISGAFGIFRAKMLRHIGGWDAGTAEDLDITLRLKSYLGRHPALRLAFAPDAIAHTDVPETLYDFFRQRMRWDGDLSYMYLRKHSLVFQRNLLGFANWLSLFWTGLLFQIVFPFIIVLYTTIILCTMPLEYIVSLFFMIYTIYLGVTAWLLLTFILFVSERRKQDCALFIILPLFPLFTFFTRCVSAFACAWEMFGKGHLDSAMAPWWVLKKSRY